MNTRATLDASRIAPAALSKIENFHRAFLKQLVAEVDAGGVVVIGMRQNPVCRAVRKVLDEAEVKYKYLEYGSYVGEWKKRLAIKLWSGWPTFPQVFVHGKLVGGCSEVKDLIADDSFKKMIAGK